MLAVIDNVNIPNSINSLYEDIENKIYNIENKIKYQIILHNLTPIKYKNMKFLVTSFNGLEHLFLDKDKKIIIKYFIDKDNYGDIILKKYLNLLDVKEKSDEFTSLHYSYYDSYYDEHTNLLFIKFQDICIKYFDIEDINIERLLYNNLINQNVNIKFIDHTINSKIINDKISSNYKFNNNYFSLPPVPYLSIDSDKQPFKGSQIVDENNNLIGIVNNLINNKIIITPLLNILRSLKYFEGNMIKALFFDYRVIKNQFSNINISKIKNDNVLLITNFSGYKDEKKYMKSSYGKIFQINNIIYSINDHYFDNEGNIMLNGLNIPIYTYLWLLMLKKADIKFIPNTKLNNVNFEEENIILNYSNFTTLCLKTKELNLIKLDKVNTIKISKLKYLNTDNIYIIELNEKILSIIKNYMIQNKQFHSILDKIYENRYSDKSRKILLYLRIKKNNKHVIEIINEYKSIHSLEKKLSKLKDLEIIINDDKIKLLKI
jgi:hypothetical protein